MNILQKSFKPFATKLKAFSFTQKKVWRQQYSAVASKGGDIFKLQEEFPLALGGSLPEISIKYETWGPTNAPVVVVLPALSASSHAASTTENPEPGWWEGVLGAGKGIDTSKYRVICAAILGSPFGTTSPVSINPNTGKRYGKNFPAITTSDMARCHKKLLDHLGYQSVHCIVGSSLGGMQVLQFAALFPDYLNRFISISATGKSTPGTVALRRVQRTAIMTDPKFNDGDYEPENQPTIGMRVARELGVICYRSRDEFNDRFDWNPSPPYDVKHATFEVERYLQAAAEKFVNKYDANCYLLLSRAMDLQDLGYGFKHYYEGVERIKAKGSIIGVDRDALIPPEEQRHLYLLLKALGRDVRYEILSSLFGHDAFLKDITWFGSTISKFLAE